MPTTYDYFVTSEQSYALTMGKSPDTELGSGWVVDTVSVNVGASGLNAVTFVNDDTKEVIVAFRGTDFTSAQDLAIDAQMLAGILPNSFLHAVSYVQSAMQDVSRVGYTYSVTGHSKGGAEAQYAAAVANVKAVTFGAPGILSLLPASYDGLPLNVRNFIIDADPVATTPILSGVHFGVTQNLGYSRSLAEKLLSIVSTVGVTGLLPFEAYAKLQPHFFTSYGDALAAAGLVASNPILDDSISAADFQAAYDGITNAYTNYSMDIAVKTADLSVKLTNEVNSILSTASNTGSEYIKDVEEVYSYISNGVSDMYRSAPDTLADALYASYKQTMIGTVAGYAQLALKWQNSTDPNKETEISAFIGRVSEWYEDKATSIGGAFEVAFKEFEQFGSDVNGALSFIIDKWSLVPTVMALFDAYDSDTNGAGGVATGAGAAGGIGAVAGTEASLVPATGSPIALDLDGDGVEVEGGKSSGTEVFFDLNGDGVKTSNSWLNADDAWLALDLNANGVIDSGQELFGDNTTLQDGSVAQHGYIALAEYDENADGLIDASDTIFANLKLWSDINQDGISQSNELTSLSSNNIQSIGVSAETGNWHIGDNNFIIAKGTYTKTDGSVGATGETVEDSADVDLYTDTFHREFATDIPLTDQAMSLPNLTGSGQVRDLDEAISLSSALGDDVEEYLSYITRDQQVSALDSIIESWADTSTFKSLQQQASALASYGVSLD